MANITHDDILAYLEGASILELNDLVKAIEDKFGVTAAAPVAVAAAPAEAAAEGPTSVSVILTGFGESKTGVIKVVKEITGLGLVEAKGLVDKCPSPIKENIVGIRIATDDQDVMLITNSGTIIRLKVKDISVLGRSTQGVTLMRTSGEGKVVSIETIDPEME